MAADWRDEILRHFLPSIERVYLVADPDGVLLDEEIGERLKDTDFVLLELNDPVAFRFQFESEFRQLLEGAQIRTGIVVRIPSSDYNDAPYDILKRACRISLSLSNLFPALDYHVVNSLDKACFDDLYHAISTLKPVRLGKNTSADFVLANVYDIQPDLIVGPADLLATLLNWHAIRDSAPSIICDRLVDRLISRTQFHGWPLGEIIRDRKIFLDFLQERWSLFLDRVAGEEGITAPGTIDNTTLRLPGPRDLPFEAPKVRLYINSLFLSDALKPVGHARASELAGQWVRVGLALDPISDQTRKLSSLIVAISGTIPKHSATHREWIAFAWKWAQLNKLWQGLPFRYRVNFTEEIEALQDEVDEAFLNWTSRRYVGLHNQPSVPPTMVHHIVRVVAREIEDDPHAKAALIVLDGLALDQWLIIRDLLDELASRLDMSESGVFAWIPTITVVSRQSIFAGNPPSYYPESIKSTSREANLWGKFWTDHGLTPIEVAYLRGLGDNGDLAKVAEKMGHPKLRVLGLVVDTIDQIMHGMVNGMSGMHNQVRQWVESGFLLNLCQMVLEGGFKIHLTSDHGNVEARGLGRPSEGSIAESKGERVRVYGHEPLRAAVKHRFPEAIEWSSHGLPADYLPLIAPRRTAFVSESELIVGHGGVALEEVIVPYVCLQRRAT